MTDENVDYTVELDARVLGDEITPSAALALFADDAVGFAYTPSESPWFRLTAGTARQRDGSPIPEDTFELRAFTRDRELRWWRTSGFDLGRAVMLAEAPAVDGGVHPLCPKQSRSLLLWGAATGKYEHGWAQVADRRVGYLWFPIAAPPAAGAGLRLAVVDYVSQDAHGNVGVVDQRLVGVEAL